MRSLLASVLTNVAGLLENVTKRDLSFNNFEFPIEASDREKEIINFSSRFSMTGKLRMWGLLSAINYVNNAEIAGDLVECGVWKGGNLMLMNLAMSDFKGKRKIIGYDTFDGMTEPTDKDFDYLGRDVRLDLDKYEKNENVQNIHAYASIDQVRKNISLMSERNCEISLVEGPVEITLLRNHDIPNQIAVLRLDTDWYESTKVELESLFPRLAKGGILIIDDYGHFDGARKAFEEYFKNHKYYVHYVDYTCRILIKS